MQVFSEFHDVSADKISDDDRMAGCVQVNADPAGLQEEVSMKSDHPGCGFRSTMHFAGFITPEIADIPDFILATATG
jgi:hypothetical protein